MKLNGIFEERTIDLGKDQYSKTNEPVTHKTVGSVLENYLAHLDEQVTATREQLSKIEPLGERLYNDVSTTNFEYLNFGKTVKNPLSLLVSKLDELNRISFKIKKDIATLRQLEKDKK